MRVHGIYWHTPAERRAELLRSVRRAVVEGSVLLLVGGGLVLGALWTVRIGIVSERVYFVAGGVLLAALVAFVVWVIRRDIATHGGLYDWDDETDALSDTKSHE